MADDTTLEGRLVTALAKIGLATKTRDWHEAGAAGLTPTQGQALALLRTRAPLRLAAVAEALGITRPTASAAVATLVRKGLVAKRRAADDGRAVALTLSTRGARAAAEAATWPDFLLAAIAPLSTAERTVLYRALVKIIRTLQVAGEIAPARMCVSCRYFLADAHPGTARPHHCAFVDAAFAGADLRLDCPDHEAASAAEAERAWERFVAVGEPLTDV